MTRSVSVIGRARALVERAQSDAAVVPVRAASKKTFFILTTLVSAKQARKKIAERTHETVVGPRPLQQIAFSATCLSTKFIEF